MSTAQLQQIITKEILTIQDETLLEQILELMQKKEILEINLKKTSSKKKISRKIGINNPKHPYFDKLSSEEEIGVAQSLKEYAEGKFTRMKTKEDIHKHFSNLRNQ